MRKSRIFTAVFIALLALPVLLAAGKTGYAGKATCESCHTEVAASCAKTPHAKALDTLKAAGSDTNPECLSCHVTGLEGDEYVDGAVSCEACHGPGAAHVAADASAKEGTLTKPTEDTCKKCHTPDWSPDWDYAKYAKTGIHAG